MKNNHLKLCGLLLPIAFVAYSNISLAAVPLTPSQIAQQQAAQKAAATAAAQKAAATAAAQKAAATANISSAAASKAAASSALTNKASVTPSSASSQNLKKATAKIAEPKSLSEKQNVTAINGGRAKLSSDASGPTDTNSYVTISPTGQ
ncbi:hypothetical protein ICN35_01610 [Polynucleobacter sp. es-GGE-1]|uniref:hypothetical protein n=1 Tax=Polynucleobacter sp. es-GGE-1 TaxID=1819724 RepID=UPI001C0B597A|nr:hypothetical protein [Polynucleobacter sp. es-GGE-1]MBU3634149.1 hypothetical protein [Polynucleobacter sp. es-GGE-1]